MILVTRTRAKERTHGPPRGSSVESVNELNDFQEAFLKRREELEKQSREMMADLKRQMEYGDSSLPPELVTILGEDDVVTEIRDESEHANTLIEEERSGDVRETERDPFDVEAQKEIERILKQKRNDEMYEQAMQDSPELILNVIMLYCNMELNGHKMKVFIDKGAQMSIMGLDCARQCNLQLLRHH